MTVNEHTTAGQPDSEIVQRFIRGDTDAFCILIKKYQSVLFNLICRMTGDRDDAADVLQNVFLKAYEKIHTIKPAGKFQSWIYTIAVNECINFVHHRDRMTHLIEESCISVDDTPDVQLQKTDVTHSIEQALLRLDTEQRIIIILKHYGEQSYREISKILGIPEKTVKSRLYSARQELRRLLITPEKHGADGGRT